MSNPPYGADPGGFPPPPDHPPGWSPRSTDPLIPTDLHGWFGRSIRVFRRSFWRLSLIALIVGLLGAVSAGAAMAFGLTDLLNTSDGAVDPVAVIVFIAVVSLIVIVGFACWQAASLHLAVMDAAGRPTTIGGSLRFGVRRTLPLIGWSLLTGIAVAIGFLLLIGPGIYLAVVLNASLACAVVIERDGPGRCFELIRHRFWATFGRLVLGWVIIHAYQMLVPILLSSPFQVSWALTPPDPSSGAGMIVGSLLVAGWGIVLCSPVVVASLAITLVTYAELRGHENPDITTDAIADELTRP